MNRHELDPVSLIFGFVFTGLGLLFLIGRADQALRLQWIWPLLLLALGAGILLYLTRDRGRQALEPDPEVGSGVGVEDRVGSRSGVEDQVGSRSGVEDRIGTRSGVEDQVRSRSGVEGEEDAGVEGSVDNREQLR